VWVYLDTQAGRCKVTTHSFIMGACVGVCVAKQIRVEAYLPQELMATLEEESDNRSAFIREAVRRELQRREVNNEL